MKPIFSTIVDASDHLPHPIFRIGALTIVLGNILAFLASYVTVIEATLRILILVAALIVSVMHIFERRHSHRRRVRRRPTRVTPPLPLPAFLLFLPALFLCGCTAIHSNTYDPASHTRTSSMTAFAFFDSRGSLSQFSNSPTNGTTIGSIEGTATSTNLNTLIGTVVGAAISAAK